MNCCPAGDITAMAESFFAVEKEPEIIRVDFRMDQDYGLLLGRNVPFTLAAYFNYNEESDTYTMEPGGWSYVTLEFHADLDVSNGPISTHTFPVIDQGVIDPDYVPGTGTMPEIDKSERWQGVFPMLELNKLAGQEWVFARLLSSNNEVISLCVFKVMGG